MAHNDPEKRKEISKNSRNLDGKIIDQLDIFYNQDIPQYVKSLESLHAKQGRRGGYDEELQKFSDNELNKFISACRRIEKDIRNNKSLSEEDREEILKLCKNDSRAAIGSLLYKSWLTDRAYRKPRGYPGDYELLETIYDNIPVSMGIGRYLDNFFLGAELAIAVRNRKDLMRTILEEEIKTRGSGVSILNLACGPCREWQEMLPNLNTPGVKLIGVDVDDKALEYSKRKLKEVKKEGDEIILIRDNILKIGRRSDDFEKYGKQDVIYSIGLFDYIPDGIVERVLPKYYDLLKSGGKLLFSLKDGRRYDPTCYDWQEDWTFVYREEKDGIKLAETTGAKPKSIKTRWEPSGRIVFFEVTKT